MSDFGFNLAFGVRPAPGCGTEQNLSEKINDFKGRAHPNTINGIVRSAP